MQIGDLNQKIRQRLEMERAETEAAACQTLQRLQENLSACVKDALTTTENAIRCQNTAMNQRLSENAREVEKRYSLLSWAMLKAWIVHCLLAAALLAGVFGGSWGFTKLLAQNMTSVQQGIADLEREKAQLVETIAAMENKTWGLRLHSDKNGRFIVLPPGIKAASGWTIGKQQALKLE